MSTMVHCWTSSVVHFL